MLFYGKGRVWEKGKRGNLILVFKAVKGLERVYREEVLMRHDGRTEGHEYEIRNTRCVKDMKQFSWFLKYKIKRNDTLKCFF